jgi:hypothetical protein
MANLFWKMRYGIKRLFTSPVKTPRVILCDVRQVPPPRFSDLSRSCHPPIRRKRITVRRKPRPDWQEHGWQRTTGGYEGYYLVNGKRYKGRAKKRGTSLDFYVLDPPSQVQHNPCFRHRGRGCYWVHWHGSPPRTISSGIISVELAIRKVMT